jgi:hypothetical protein
MINELPEYMMKLHNIDIMIEAKLKEQAISFLHTKYPQLLDINN